MDARSEEKLSCAQKRRKIYANNWAKCCINSDIDNFIRLHKRKYKFENGSRGTKKDRMRFNVLSTLAYTGSM